METTLSRVVLTTLIAVFCTSQPVWADLEPDPVIFGGSFETPEDWPSIPVFNVSPESIVEGESALVSWSTKNSESCTASDGVGDWAGSTIQRPDGSKSISTSITGNHSFTLTCSGDGHIVTAYSTLTVNPAASITSFEVSPNTVETGSDVTLALSWVSENTSSGCFGSWPDSDALLSSGTDSINVTDIQPGTEYTLTCSNDFDDDTSTTAVTVFDPASITSFEVSPNTAETGSDVTLALSWVSENTSSGCFGSWPNSDALLSSGTDSINVTDIQPGTEYTLTCSNDFDEDTSTAAVTVSKIASITSFEVNPNTAVTGSDVTLTLTWVSENTSGGCFGSWPNSDALLSSGTDSISITDIQPGTEYTLTCSNDVHEDTSTVAVTVNDPAPGCDVTLSANKDRYWFRIFGTPWPGPDESQIRIAVPETGYYSVQFETGDIVDSGAVTNFEASGTAGTTLTAISETSGCFDVVPECKTRLRDPDIGWDTTGKTAGCQLKPNTTYYWNITFTDGVTPSSSTCIGTFCERYLRVVNSDYGD